MVNRTYIARRAYRNMTFSPFTHTDTLSWDRSCSDLHFPHERVSHRALASDRSVA